MCVQAARAFKCVVCGVLGHRALWPPALVAVLACGSTRTQYVGHARTPGAGRRCKLQSQLARRHRQSDEPLLPARPNAETVGTTAAKHGSLVGDGSRRRRNGAHQPCAPPPAHAARPRARVGALLLATALGGITPRFVVVCPPMLPVERRSSTPGSCRASAFYYVGMVVALYRHVGD